MPAVFEHRHVIGPHEIDAQGHANNVAYIQWMQDAALAHSAAQGWPGPRYREFGFGWVARSHHIDYRLPGFVDEAIVVRTWVATMKRVSSVRRYRILRAADAALLAEAETNWAFVSYATGQPTRIPPEIIASFILVDDPSAAFD